MVTVALDGFLSTLSLRRATSQEWNPTKCRDISIHALLAESDFKMPVPAWIYSFLSTLSLRRATTWQRGSRITYVEFLSTLSLRRATLVVTAFPGSADISIHALLAESDTPPSYKHRIHHISIHALLAESDVIC